MPYDDFYDEILHFVVRRIQGLRETRGMSARELSLSIGMHKNYINMVEAKKIRPTLEGLVNICEYFGLTLNEFLDESTDRPIREKELLGVVRKLDDEAFGYLLGIATKLSEGKK